MFEVLTGTGLAASAGLNAYIPLLIVGLLARFTDLFDLPDPWQWLSNGWVIAIMAVLLVVEVVADKVPVLDHINDVLQTAIRPAAGGLVFGAGAAPPTATAAKRLSANPANADLAKCFTPLLVSYRGSLAARR